MVSQGNVLHPLHIQEDSFAWLLWLTYLYLFILRHKKSSDKGTFSSSCHCMVKEIWQHFLIGLHKWEELLWETEVYYVLNVNLLVLYLHMHWRLINSLSDQNLYHMCVLYLDKKMAFNYHCILYILIYALNWWLDRQERLPSLKTLAEVLPV